ncbi:MAG: S41 family peptidase, partial [Bacteroidota bacterium]
FNQYPSQDEMKKFGEELLKYIRENKITNFVIDLRQNYGGDFFVGISLAYYLNLADSIDWEKGTYVLVDNVTFSAATTNATQFKQILNAKVVGEPTGSNPSGYQDMGQFELPNSKLTITYSKRLFRIQEKLGAALEPDVIIHYNWEEYLRGNDNMLEWILNDLRGNNP